MKLIAVLALVALTGCATQGPQKLWYKDGSTQETFGRDKMYCRQYGMQSAMSSGLAGNMFVEIHINNEAIECMRNLGWVLR